MTHTFYGLSQPQNCKRCDDVIASDCTLCHDCVKAMGPRPSDEHDVCYFCGMVWVKSPETRKMCDPCAVVEAAERELKH